MAKPAFTYTEKQVGNTLLLQFAGSIDENTKFPPLKSGGRVSLNMRRVTGLNSNGTRSWCVWLAKQKPPLAIMLEEVPVLVVKSFTMVQGFLTPNTDVLSFFVPFYSDETGERNDFLAVKDRHYFPGGRLDLPQIKDSKGNVMELDVIPEHYFGFLK